MNKIQNLTWKGSREKPLVLDAYWPEKGENLPVVLFAHGYKGFKDWGASSLFGEKLAASGCLFIKFNFSFNGGTVENPIDFPDLEAFGQNNYSTEVNDISRMLDFVEFSHVLPREKINTSNITLIGHSRGGGMSILAAARDKRISKLVTLASISDLERRQPKGADLDEWKASGVRYVKNGRTKQLMPHYYQMHEDYIAHKDELDISKAAASIQVPWMILHGTADEAVPFSEAEELKELQPKVELVELDGANHVFGARHPWPESDMPEDLKVVCDHILNFCGLSSF